MKIFPAGVLSPREASTGFLENAAVSLLEKNSQPTEADIREGLAGNLCRCTGYMKIFESVVRACRAV